MNIKILTKRRAIKAAVVAVSAVLAALCLSSSAVAAQAPRDQAAAQVLTWTADNSMMAYKSAPTTATAGPATIVFENSTATGNTTGMTHTLTAHTVRYRATDKAGNTSDVGTARFTVIAGAPKCSKSNCKNM